MTRKPADKQLAGQWRMPDHLHPCTGGIPAIETTRPVPVGSRYGKDSYVRRHQKSVPEINVFNLGQNKTDVIQPLRGAFQGGYRRPVQGKIIVTARQVDVIRIGTPLHLHTQQLHVKVFTSFQRFNKQRHVAHTGSSWGTVIQRLSPP